MEIKTLLLDNFKNLQLPERATQGSAGIDLRAAIDEDILITKGSFMLIPTGIAIELPEGYEAQIRPRSGLAFKHGITVLNTPGTIDSDYRGEIKVLLINLGNNNFNIQRGERIAQMVVAKYEKATLIVKEKLADSSRSAGGFGSTGKK